MLKVFFRIFMALTFLVTALSQPTTSVSADYEFAFFYAAQVNVTNNGIVTPAIKLYMAKSLGLNVVDVRYPTVSQALGYETFLSEVVINTIKLEDGTTEVLEYGRIYSFALVKDLSGQPESVLKNFDIELIQPGKYGMEIEMPSEVIYGHHPIDVIVKITNTSSEPWQFDGMITIQGDAGNGEISTKKVDNGIAYSYGIDRTFSFNWMGGYLNPGETASLSFTTYSWVFETTNPEFLEVSIGGHYETRALTVVSSTEPASGKLWFSNYKDGRISTGWQELIMLNTGPQLTQFVMMSPMTSTCGIEYLPQGFTGNVQRTWEERNFYVKIPENFNGPCSIKATVTMWTLNESFDITYNFYVGQPKLIFLPLITH